MIKSKQNRQSWGTGEYLCCPLYIVTGIGCAVLYGSIALIFGCCIFYCCFNDEDRDGNRKPFEVRQEECEACYCNTCCCLWCDEIDAKNNNKGEAVGPFWVRYTPDWEPLSETV